MRPVFVGTRQINEAAHRLVGRRCQALFELRHGLRFGVHALVGLHHRGVRHVSTAAPASGLKPSIYDGLSSTGTVVTHPMSLEDLAPPHISSQKETKYKQPETAYPMIAPSLYETWEPLSLDPSRLRIESNVNSPSPDGYQLLVDQAGNENDIILWSVLLRFQWQRMGRDGVATIWQAVNKRRNLHEVEGAVAEAFWQTILNNALHDDDLLESVWLYAEWLFEVHGVKIPKIYTTIISFHLAQERYPEALRWHFRLSPNLDPGHTAFVALIKSFVAQEDDELRKTLRNLYSFSQHRHMYDDLIPYLFDQGQSGVANQWRRFLVQNGDVPATAVAGPFLRYLAAFHPRNHPDTQMTSQELLVAGMDEEESLEPAQRSEHAFNYFVNRVHGEYFGIQEKKFNDTLGAKLFASSWISLDFAITAIHTLGIPSIGPLSLQSIALRENSAAGIRRRLSQLHSLYIGIGTTKYSKAIRHLARMDDYETLQELLHSDVHPHVFEEMREKLLDSWARDGDWKNRRLMAVVHLAASIDSIRLFSNELLQASIEDNNVNLTLQVLKDMRDRDVDISPSASNAISEQILKKLSWHKNGNDRGLDVDYSLATARYLAGTAFPPPAMVWQRVITRLGREGRIEELEKVSLEIMRMYTSWKTCNSPIIIVHKDDVPEGYRSQSAYQNFQVLPRDFPLKSDLHPVHQIFHVKLQKSIVRWAFNHILKNRQAVQPAMRKRSQPSDYYIARGVRLLRIMKDNGLKVNPSDLEKAVLLRLTDFFGPTILRLRGLAESKYANRMGLEEIKDLFDDAWGEEFLPPLSEIEEYIAQLGHTRLEDEREYMESVLPLHGRTRRLRPVAYKKSRHVHDRPRRVTF